MRIAIHTQHFAGVGHRVRATRLARALRQMPGSCNEVLVFDGGRPYAGADPDDDRYRVQLPPVAWGDAGLEAFDRDQSLPAVLAARQKLFVDGLRRLRPDLLLIDSFPFSRWVLRDEILAGIRQAKAGGSAVRVVCSLRDVPRAAHRTRATRPGDDGCEQVPDLLNEHFDTILVHGDPRVTRLEEHFPWVHKLGVPIHYTGYVQQEAGATEPRAATAAAGPLLVVSVGGGVNGRRLIEVATAAYSELRQQPPWTGSRMVVFAGALMSVQEHEASAAACRLHGAEFKAFSCEFPAWLEAADLSISRGGYNTMVAVLAAGVRGLVLPGVDVSDQAFRTRRLADLGIVTTGPEAELDPGSLATLIGAALARPPPVHDLDLGGSERTVQLLTELVAARVVAADPAATAYR